MKHICFIVILLSLIFTGACSQFPTGKWYSADGKQILEITKEKLVITQDPRYVKKMNSIFSFGKLLSRTPKQAKSPYGDMVDLMSQSTMGLNLQYNGIVKQTAPDEIEVVYSSMFTEDKSVIYIYEVKHGILYLEDKNPLKPNGFMGFMNPLNLISHTWFRDEQPLSKDVELMAQVMKDFNPEDIYKNSKSESKSIPFKPIPINTKNPFIGTLECEKGLASGSLRLIGTANDLSLESKLSLFGSKTMNLGKYSYKIKNNNSLELYLSPEEANSNDGVAFEIAQFKIIKGKLIITGSAQLNGTWVKPR